jgi:hypothetical protein
VGREAVDRLAELPGRRRRAHQRADRLARLDIDERKADDAALLLPVERDGLEELVRELPLGRLVRDKTVHIEGPMRPDNRNAVTGRRDRAVRRNRLGALDLVVPPKVRFRPEFRRANHARPVEGRRHDIAAVLGNRNV